MTYKEMKETGILSVMPNGFNIYVDDDDIDYDYDTDLELQYTNNRCYENKTLGISLTQNELELCEVTCIASDPGGDFVPAVYVKVPDMTE